MINRKKIILIYSSVQKSSTLSIKTDERFIASQIQKINEALTARHYSEHTKISYKKLVKEFLTIYQGKEDIGEREINEFLKI